MNNRASGLATVTPLFPLEDTPSAPDREVERRHPVEGVQLRLFLSNNEEAIVERDAHGIRILQSSYGWLNPRGRVAYYLRESSLSGGCIYATAHFVGEDGSLGEGREFESVVTVVGRVQMPSD